MPGPTEFKADVISQIEGFSELEAPRQVVYRPGDLFSLGSPQLLELHGILEHRQDQGHRGMGADDLPLEPLPDQCRQQTDVVDMRMRQKDEIHRGGFDRPIVNGHCGIAPLGDPAVDEDVVTPYLHQPAGPGDAILTA